MTLPSHGSNPHYLYESLNLPHPEHCIDFSANLNPLGPPLGLKEKWSDAYHLITTYPDPNASSLTRKLASDWNVEERNVLIGNGGAELISLVGRFLSGKRVCIVQPTFSEYELACETAGCEITYHQLEEGSWRLDPTALIKKMPDIDALFLCSPNNPTGIAYHQSAIKTILEETEKLSCFLIVDEAFGDFLLDEVSMITYAQRYSKLIVLRSLTKMYAIPGLRLGYMVGNEDVLRNINVIQPPWSVNALALMAGEYCLSQRQHVTLTRNHIQQERKKLQHFFEEYHYVYSQSSVNFHLIRDPQMSDQSDLLQFLLSHGLVPRHTYNFPGLEGRWLRFAIRNSRENQQLMEVLARWRT